MKSLLVLLLVAIGFSCRQPTPAIITQRADYQQFLREDTLRPAKIRAIEQEAEFWQKKIRQQPNGFSYVQKLATLHRRQFELTGRVEHLHHSDSLFELANSLVVGKQQLGNFIALSSNAVQQHEFQKALDYSWQAYEVTPEKFGPAMMMYDALSELGENISAENIILANRKSDSFDYLVRLSKYLDQTGNLDSAITVMEKAVFLNDRKELHSWALTHLGDLYGHAGRISKSYTHYLHALRIDPDYVAPLRGIAWIAYSHDRDPVEAETILQAILRKTALPDTYLLLAEIADYQGDLAKKKKHISRFLNQVTQPQYGHMYNQHLVTLYAKELNDLDRAIRLAQEEVQRRATPQTYDRLAWAYYLGGDRQRALEIVQTQVEDRTLEPEVLYHMGVIYLKNGHYNTGKRYLLEAQSAEFELGPLTIGDIRSLDSSLSSAVFGRIIYH